jgi:hypothetical protein
MRYLNFNTREIAKKNSPLYHRHRTRGADRAAILLFLLN